METLTAVIGLITLVVFFVMAFALCNISKDVRNTDTTLFSTSPPVRLSFRRGGEGGDVIGLNSINKNN
jgi:hypothetical protein